MLPHCNQMRVHYLQHVSFEGLGYIGEWFTGKGASLTSTRFWEVGWKLPVVEEIDALIVMGGPMGVYDEQEYPWLVAEKAFIESCLLAGKKVLGICLGAQLLSVCLGAEVHRAPNKEIGWFPVAPTEASKGIPWLHELFVARPLVFHWHGDQFGIPETGLDLLLSAANSNQAFYYNENVIGLQFHLEVTDDTLRQMVEHGVDELVEATYVQTAEKIVSETGNIEASHQMMKAILGRWLG